MSFRKPWLAVIVLLVLLGFRARAQAQTYEQETIAEDGGTPDWRVQQRLFDSGEPRILGPAPGSSLEANRSESSRQADPTLDSADGEPLTPGHDAATADTALKRHIEMSSADTPRGEVPIQTQIPEIEKSLNNQPGRSTWSPMWITMGLFFSLAANLFFAWVAWDTHSRYQDLVEDMSERDARLRRQKRRLADSDEQTRETGEIEFLQRGLDA